MKLIDTNTGDKLEAIIERVIKLEIKKLKKSKEFVFDWSLEVENDISKIRLINDNEILGLISLIDYPDEFRIHINLIESATKYRGKNKPLLNIAGCLIAFACKLSFKKGYDGFVSLIPKTELINYYNKNYEFQQMGTHMAVYYELSNSIIEKFFGDE